MLGLLTNLTDAEKLTQAKELTNANSKTKGTISASLEPQFQKGVS